MAITETSPGTDAPAPPEDQLLEQSGTGGTDHKVIGTLFIVAALVFLVVGGVLAGVMRAQLSGPDVDIVGATAYRQLFTMHGVIMVFLFLLPMWLGLAGAIVPLQIGATRLAFPRLHALSLWLFVAGAGMVCAAPLVSDVISGWALSGPLPEGYRVAPGHGPDLLVLGLIVVAVAAIVSAINLIVTILQLRAPGLTPVRLPLFSWTVAVSSSVMLLALPVLVGALVLLFVDRHYAGPVFSGFTGSRGGDPLLWPRLFWFAAYPLLWALLLPALGVIGDIVPVLTRGPLFSRARAGVAVLAIAVLAFFGWGSEVPTLSRAKLLFAVAALAVLAPLALLLLNLLVSVATAARTDRGMRRRLGSPLGLHVVGFVTVLGVGMAGAVVSALDATGASHTNYWSIATHHTLFFGPATIAAAAALVYWAPKLWGHSLSENLSRFQALALTVGSFVTFLPMFVLGAQDMGMGVGSYDAGDGWTAANLVSTLGAALLVFGVLLLVVNLLSSVVAGRGEVATADPWGGRTLEWSTPSPPPPYNFDTLPEVRSDSPLVDLGPTSDPHPER
jgi:cytochrome c oxidase subunit 1